MGERVLDEKGRIFITHPNVDAYTRVKASAFDKVWKRKGWTEVSGDEVFKAEEAEKVAAQKAEERAAKAAESSAKKEA